MARVAEAWNLDTEVAVLLDACAARGAEFSEGCDFIKRLLISFASISDNHIISFHHSIQDRLSRSSQPSEFDL